MALDAAGMLDELAGPDDGGGPFAVKGNIARDERVVADIVKECTMVGEPVHRGQGPGRTQIAGMFAEMVAGRLDRSLIVLENIEIPVYRGMVSQQIPRPINVSPPLEVTDPEHLAE